jgi:hypothetical protein
MNLSKLSPRQRRFNLRYRRHVKKVLPQLLHRHRRRKYQADLAAKRPRMSRRLRHELNVQARIDARIEHELALSGQVKPVFE